MSKSTIDAILRTKRDGGTLSREQIETFVRGVVSAEVPDYQAAAFLMATYIRGMDLEETTHLTRAYVESGRRITFPELGSRAVDKHSSGGVGDKVSLILAPLAAACGAAVPMLSGRGLGHTGGTLDKLESIPGFRTDLTLEEYRQQVLAIGCAIIAQSPEITPADGKLYALRDVTETVPSIPLICASIISKKVAAGPRGLVLDVKCGNGAFMTGPKQATQLAKWLIGIGNGLGMTTVAYITDMSQVLGSAAGNALEVAESIACLSGHGPRDLWAVTRILTARMLVLAGVASRMEEALERVEKARMDGSALRRFGEMIAAQGGNAEVVDRPELLPKANFTASLRMQGRGYLASMDTFAIGRLLVSFGAGRKVLTDKIDPGVGFLFKRKLGDFVEAGEELVELHLRSEADLPQAEAGLRGALTCSALPVEVPNLILDYVETA